MIRHMRHGSSPRLMTPQPIRGPNRREALATPSAGDRMTPRPYPVFYRPYPVVTRTIVVTRPAFVYRPRVVTRVVYRRPVYYRTAFYRPRPYYARPVYYRTAFYR